MIRPGADWAGHVPGQYVRIGVDVDGVRQWRAYSLTHGPRADRRISVTVKAVPDGLVSHHLVHDMLPGTLVHLEQAAGEFVLPPTGGRFLFVTAGSGITPVIGMLRNLFPSTDEGVLRPGRSAAYDVVVVHVAPSRPDSIFLRDLEALAAAGAIKLVARYDDVHGVLDIEELPGAGARPRRAPHVRVRPGRAARRARAVPRRQGPGAVHRAVPHRPGRARRRRHGHLRQRPDVDADGATPILDVAEDAGVLMPSGCRMGICFGCVLPMTEGSVRDLRNGQITTAVPGESGAIKIQTCISAAAGACHLDHPRKD